MSRKRILLIADSDALWTQRYIEYLLLPDDAEDQYEIVIFPIWGDGKRYEHYYQAQGITVYQDKHHLPLIRYIPRLRMWARVAANARQLRKLGPFDVVHNHYLSQRDLALGWRMVKAFGARWVCSFWGSDLMRSSRLELARMKPYLNRCDAITVHSELNRTKIREFYGQSYADKTTLLYFGQIGYHYIDEIRKEMTKEQCKQYFGISKDRYVICVGYSASSAQQQLPVLEAISLLTEETQRRITLVLQQTYSQNDPDYVKRVREYAGRLPCQTVVLTDFMDGEDSARLRLSADLFILAITTDAFSGSMQEYLYAGATIIKGDWLGYPQLKDMGIEINDFHQFDELPGMISLAMEHRLNELSAEQRALFPKLYSWPAVRSSWLSLY
ncbi:MAG: glycosyltransferase family 4 protein [Eubacteriales bacterium]|nr:glycosyltransferase family 4 protein [Eubacteriales bacterium]